MPVPLLIGINEGVSISMQRFNKNKSVQKYAVLQIGSRQPWHKVYEYVSRTALVLLEDDLAPSQLVIF